MLPRIPEPEVMDSTQEALDYDQMDHRAVNQTFVDDLLRFLESVPDVFRSRNLQVLDLGTGTAQIPVLLLQAAPEFGTVTACDLSLEMLKLGNSNVTQAGFSEKIQLIFCDAKTLPVADASVDVLISNSIIHHIPEPADVFREVRRCIRPGGVIFFRDLLRPRDQPELELLVQTWAGDANSHQKQMFRESLHAALTVTEVQAMIAALGLDPDSVSQTSDRHWTLAALIPGP